MMSRGVNYRMMDGDTVQIVKPCEIKQYWHCQDSMTRGSWSFASVLPGTVGKVIKARTPCVSLRKNEPIYFANVDILIEGNIYRVREYHSHFKKIRGCKA